MSTLDRRARQLARSLAGVAVTGLLVLAFATAADVLLRYAFAMPIRGFVDVVSLAGAVLLAACLPHVVATRGNIAVDFLGRRIGPRAQYWLDVFGAFAVFVFFALMAWQYLRYTIDMKSTGEVMAILRWPVWPWWAAVTLFVFITALVALATLTHREEASA
ncbi:MAG: TRAP transporter small permease [Burkholderiales bacterium]|nr:TRAP transporter small permease [Burkholderiales bacterium]